MTSLGELMIKVSIAGATGYTGIELLRLLRHHPEVEIVRAGTESYIDQNISKVYPHLQSIVELKGIKHDAEQMAAASDVVFTALPHGIAMQMAPAILKFGKKLIDIGSDFRLQNPTDYENWYQQKSAPQTLLAQAVYGLAEVGFRSAISKAQFVANPGCYPTGCALAAFPALQADIIKTAGIIFDAKSGVSGAGRAASLNVHFSEITENFKAYSIAGTHRHTPEIEQTLTKIAGDKITVQFTPHLVPMVRGLLTTAYLPLKKSMKTEQVWEIYSQIYANEPFIRLREIGDLPQTKQVNGSNFCDIGLQVDTRTQNLIVISAIDNLVKGASGQAVQNMNLMFGLPETLGLRNLIPVYP